MDKTKINLINSTQSLLRNCIWVMDNYEQTLTKENLHKAKVRLYEVFDLLSENMEVNTNG